MYAALHLISAAASLFVAFGLAYAARDILGEAPGHPRGIYVAMLLVGMCIALVGAAVSAAATVTGLLA